MSLIIVVFSFLLIGQPLLLHSKFTSDNVWLNGSNNRKFSGGYFTYIFCSEYIVTINISEKNKDKTYFLNVTVQYDPFIYCILLVCDHFLSPCKL